jgi:hypothetical protein
MKTTQLQTIQTSLKCPKNQKNSFGWYNYRSCEDILEAVKPLLTITWTTLTICDNVVAIWDRIYVEATATLKDAETGEIIEQNVAFARESESKKGMDDSQITWATSSYARKYALNGLFLLDDVKDADATNTHEKTGSTTEKKPSKYTDEKGNPNGWFSKAVSNVEYMKKCWWEEEFITNIKWKYEVDKAAEMQLREAYQNKVVKPQQAIDDLPFKD